MTRKHRFLYSSCDRIRVTDSYTIADQTFSLACLGAHINPAVSIGLLSLRKLNVVQCLFYLVGQLLGAFLACPFVYLIYWGHFNLYDGGQRQIDGPNGTADIFFTTPSEGVSNWNCLVDSIIGTVILMIFILALGNDYNQLISNVAKPFSFVLMITTFGFSMSLNCGNPINPVGVFAIAKGDRQREILHIV